MVLHQEINSQKLLVNQIYFYYLLFFELNHHPVEKPYASLDSLIILNSLDFLNSCSNLRERSTILCIKPLVSFRRYCCTKNISILRMTLSRRFFYFNRIILTIFNGFSFYRLCLFKYD